MSHTPSNVGRTDRRKNVTKIYSISLIIEVQKPRKSSNRMRIDFETDVYVK